MCLITSGPIYRSRAFEEQSIGWKCYNHYTHEYKQDKWKQNSFIFYAAICEAFL